MPGFTGFFEIIGVVNLTHSQTDFLLSYPDENRFDVEQERQFLMEKEESENEIELCAVVDGRIVGTAGIEAVGKKDKIKHRGEFGISIEKSSWGMGIGSALLAASIECAKAAGYVQLELSVVSENHRAVSMYERAGFREYGRNPKGFRSRYTGWQEIVLMRMELKYPCPCCGYDTYPVPAKDDCGYICPVCFWENDPFITSQQEPSDSNRGISLSEARKNYRDFGACDERMIAYVRKPSEEEKRLAEQLRNVP